MSDIEPIPDPLRLSDAELRAVFGPMTAADLMRTLILSEAHDIRNGAERETRTLRKLWYDLIKPVLSRSGRLNDKTSGGKDVDWDGLLSRYLVEQVRAGAVSYEELRIIDGSRQRRTATGVTRPVLSVQLVGGHYPWVILFTEKDTIWGEVESLATLYGVSAISGGGQPAATCTADIVRQIVESRAFQDYPDEYYPPLTLLSLTDYDPAGYSIAESQAQQIREVSGRYQVRHERIGLTPDQVTPEQREANAYTPKGAGLREWYAETGGVDGLPLGLELDALPLSRLRQMFAEAIEAHVDLEPRRDDLRAALVELIAWETLRPEVERRKRELIALVQRDGLGERIANTEIPDNLFTAAARAGWSTIDPVATSVGGVPLFDCIDEVRDIMREGRQ